METEMHFLVLGDCGSGKTTLTSHFVNDAALSTTEPTIAYDMSHKVLEDAQHGRLKFVLWDAAGSDHYQQALTQLYYKRKHAIIVLFDMTVRQSFVNVERLWLPRIRAAAVQFDAQWRLCLVANKLDRSHERQVTVEEAQLLAHNNQMDYMELSSLKGNYEQMRQPFLSLAVQLIEQGLVQPHTRRDYTNISVSEHNFCCVSS